MVLYIGLFVEVFEHLLQKNHEHGIVLPNLQVGLDDQDAILTPDLRDRCYLDVTFDDSLVVLVEILCIVVLVALINN